MSAGDLIRSLHPVRDGKAIFVEIGGVRIDLTPMQASLIARAWFDALSGAYVASMPYPECLGQNAGDQHKREGKEGDPQNQVGTFVHAG